MKDAQLLEPLFEFSGACAGCGETPYIKLMTQLFGDRALIANATGCSSIYGGNLPTTPYSVNKEGRGPAWSNSLFEDNAEFGMGMRLAVDKQKEYAEELVQRMASAIGEELAVGILSADQTTEAGIFAQRERVKALKAKLGRREVCGGERPAGRGRRAGQEERVDHRRRRLGLRHRLRRTGSRAGLRQPTSTSCCSTPRFTPTPAGRCRSPRRSARLRSLPPAASALPKKDIAMMAMNYGRAYVAHIAMGGNDGQTMKAFAEAEAYDGPSLIIAYSHCIAHGYDMVYGIDQQKNAVHSGHWPLFRYNPALAKEGKNPFQLDSRAPSIPLEKYIYNETRYTMLVNSNPEEAKLLLHEAQDNVNERWKLYQHMAAMSFEK